MGGATDEPLFFPGDAVHAARLAKVVAALASHELDGLLLLKHEAARYVTGFYAKGYRPFIEFAYVALVRPDGSTLLGSSVGGEGRRIARRSRADAWFELPGFRQWG